MYSAAVCWDMTDYCERIHRRTLQHRHNRLDFPRTVACLSLRQYGGQRLLQLGSAVSKVGHPTWGMIAGCGACSYHAQAYTFELLLEFALANPQLGLNLHHDDLFAGTAATTSEVVEVRLAEGMHELRRIVEVDLHATVAPHKAQVIASDFTLQKRLARKLDGLGGSGV